MRRRDAIKAIGTIAGAATLSRLLPGCARNAATAAIEQHDGVYDPNFGMFASDGSWRNSWATIVPGRFTSSRFSGLLFVEQSTGYAEVYETNGSGLAGPAIATFHPLGGRATWTHIVPGIFGPGGYTGLLFYDQVSGASQIYDCDGHGHFTLLCASTWLRTWTHIVTGRFVESSPYSAVLFYSATANYVEIWETSSGALVGSSPYRSYPQFSASGTPWTHLVAGEFQWTPMDIAVSPTLTDLYCYDATTGSGELFRLGSTAEDPTWQLVQTLASTDLPRGATSVVAGNFGGFGYTDLMFHDRAGGTLSVYSFQGVEGSDIVQYLVPRETLPGLRTSVDLVVPGNFWMSNPEDHWFYDGPPSSPEAYDPDWRFSAGGFSDLVLYDRAAGLGQFYFHEPVPPAPPQLDAYITCGTTHGMTSGLATGSVLPGECIGVHVNSQIGPYQVEIYQQTWLADGETEKRMTTIDGPPSSPIYTVGRDAYRTGAGWPADVSFPVPDWPSGVYLARVRSKTMPTISTDVPFVVRAPAPSQTRVLLVIADTTYQSYNSWGGRNTYGHIAGHDAGFVGAFPSASALRVPYGFQLSFERPYGNTLGNAVQNWELPFVRWLARQGIAVDVCTSRDLHFEAPTLANHELLLFVGHHEYWTSEMRDHVEGFTTSGGNVAFFCGNTCWWQIRLNEDGSQLTCYKVASFDPKCSENSPLTTGHWFEDPVKRPETLMTGVSWKDSRVFEDPDHRYIVRQPGHWVFAGTGLGDGDYFGDYVAADGSTLSVAGTEVDRVQTDGPHQRNHMNTPVGYEVAGIVKCDDSGSCPSAPSLGDEVGAMGTFSPSAAAGTVFNAATINWALGLARDASTWTVIDRITSNVVNGLRTRWRPWTSVSEGHAGPGVSVTAVPNGDGRFALFLADPRGGVYTALGNAWNGWTGWTSVSEGHAGPAVTVTAVPAGNGQFAVFLADPGCGVYTASGHPLTGWTGWTSVSEGCAGPAVSVTAVPTGNGQFALFLADPWGGVYTVSGSAQSGWTGWSSVSEGAAGPGVSVTAVPIGNGQFALFLADPWGGIYTASGSAQSGWTGWSNVSWGAAQPRSSVTALPLGNGCFTLFVVGTDSYVYTNSGNAWSGWSGWVRVADGVAAPGTSVTAVPYGDGRFALFVSDPEQKVYTASGNAASGWGEWTSVAGGCTGANTQVTAVALGGGQFEVIIADPMGGMFTSYGPR
jgi:hypothetical protein